jgi:flagellar basal body-associated protein FliL
MLSTGRSRDRLCIALVMIAVVILAIIAFMSSKRMEAVQDALSKSLVLLRMHVDNSEPSQDYTEPVHEPPPPPPVTEHFPERVPEPSGAPDTTYAAW